MKYDVIVIGGGAAGLLCAGTAAARGRKVLVAEKMPRPVRKVIITGKGRCNVTNNCTTQEFMKAVCSNSRFLYSAYNGFSSQSTMAFFEEWGVPLKTERGNRVFPCSERSMDIADALVRYARKNGVIIHQTPIQSLLIEEGAVVGVISEDGETILADCVVVSTGGLSYPLTGSTGHGYHLAKQAGHTIVPTRGSLVPIETKQTWPEKAMGLSLRNVNLSLVHKEELVFSEQGEMIFTHFGVSGPLVLSASAQMSQPAWEYQLFIDLKPALSVEQLDLRVLRDFEEYANKDFDNSLDKLLPKGLIPIVVQLSGIPGGTKVNQITKEQREGLVSLLKGLSLSVKSLRPIEEAVVTAGGVATDEVNPKTMESKLVKGLYFAGEVLDLDALTGGFNLQIAFSTGFAAGSYC